MAELFFTAHTTDVLTAKQHEDWVATCVRNAREAAEAYGRTLGDWETADGEAGFKLVFRAWFLREE